MRPWLKATCVAHNNQNTWTEHAQLNRFANFRLRGELGMLARGRHATSHRRIVTALSLDRCDKDFWYAFGVHAGL